MKPVHSRPFSMVDAQAGAPYCCINGVTATIIKWDCRRDGYPLLGVTAEEDTPCVWSIDGIGAYAVDQLVMLPLGMIGGKPVFTGDMLVYARKSTEFAAMAQHRQSDFDAGMGCKWPAPAKVYPQTLMTGDELRAAAYVDAFDHTVLRCVADEAIKHAIDAGQVIIAAEADQARKDVYEAGHASAYKHETASRDARDMAIAKAIMLACAERLMSRSDQMELCRVNLAEVIATVPK